MGAGGGGGEERQGEKPSLEICILFGVKAPGRSPACWHGLQAQQPDQSAPGHSWVSDATQCWGLGHGGGGVWAGLAEN